MPQFVDVNLNDFFGRTADRSRRSLSNVCAYGATQAEVPAGVGAFFAVDGAGQFRGWVNGQPFSPAGTRLGSQPRRFPGGAEGRLERSPHPGLKDGRRLALRRPPDQ
jgi:hypothetical protein